MVTFLIALAILIIGYVLYGKFVEKVFHPDDRQTPCVVHPDGVDFVPISKKRAFLVQLLNIAGLGPIFGALSGAIWGPSVYLWIVFGTIFAGAVHDFMCGMLSMRNDGASISEIVGKYLGNTMKNVMRVFSVILLFMVGVVFMVGPAGLLALLVENKVTVAVWTIIILIYFFASTFFPIDKIIGKIYPIFGVCLILMAVGIGGATVVNHINGSSPMMEMTLSNLHPDGKLIFPFMFITVACGAISGFHATQSPLMARCLTTEKEGRQVFYGAMVAEGIIALIWASAGIAFYNQNGSLLALLQAGGGNSTVVYEMSTTLLGPIGGALALLGVVACPITSGDTAFRSCRLTIADWFKIDQADWKKRLAITLPMLVFAFFVSKIDYQIIWRYFSWSNQTLAMIALWAAATYIGKYKAKKAPSLIAALPATFMSAVSSTYMLMAGEFPFKLAANIACPIGIIIAAAFFAIYAARVLIPEQRVLEE